MSDWKKHMAQRLCSARHWLVRAEESFDQEHSIRGELNLLLAQAELQRACEAKRSKHHSMRLHGLAFACAAVLAVTGIGGSYWLMHAPVTTGSPAAGTVNQFAPAPSVPVGNASRTEAAVVSAGHADAAVEEERNVPKETGMPARQQTEAVSVPAAAVSLPVQHFVVSTPEKQDLISIGDKQKLIREAGKTLRGN